VFLGVPQGQALLLGVTWHIRPAWLHAPPFHYCGNVLRRPLPLSGLQAIGDMLASSFSLQGLFGVDLVYRRDARAADALHVLEVNPRYTASVELIERAHGIALLELHRAVFEQRPIDWVPQAQAGRCWGKAVLYARDDVVFPARGPWMRELGDIQNSFLNVPSFLVGFIQRNPNASRQEVLDFMNQLRADPCFQ
jgi:predicted ATP-grasp superfamily ATP-dependent carboligase